MVKVNTRTSKELNREGWLTELALQVNPLFKGWTMGKLRLTCGWPCAQALGTKVRRLGECHYPPSSTDGSHEIFISPLLGDPLEVAGTVCHELAHVAAGLIAKHGPKYAIVCNHVGLTKGKPRFAMPGPRLEDHLKDLIERLGTYPHSAMEPNLKQKPTKPPTRVKMVCPVEGCECSVVMPVKFLEAPGAPVCGCGTTMLVSV